MNLTELIERTDDINDDDKKGLFNLCFQVSGFDETLKNLVVRCRYEGKYLSHFFKRSVMPKTVARQLVVFVGAIIACSEIGNEEETQVLRFVERNAHALTGIARTYELSRKDTVEFLRDMYDAPQTLLRKLSEVAKEHAREDRKFEDNHVSVDPVDQAANTQEPCGRPPNDSDSDARTVRRLKKVCETIRGMKLPYLQQRNACKIASLMERAPLELLECVNENCEFDKNKLAEFLKKKRQKTSEDTLYRVLTSVQQTLQEGVS